LLNWLTNEKRKDDLEEKTYKEKIIRDIKGLKEEFFLKPKKLSLWQRIRKVLGI
jgi:hypothetical protein